ncbi:Hypothetical predicted protein [Mytilus galloprovincialis]|uniref:Apple domain-containing protein n=1 Tax=Mytilus galloprovincialis TaxID=29158 RepID=A0A8B6D697_MYTGA|nr:Hypothetical predicted protein [Mytilus galloprovincialis]
MLVVQNVLSDVIRCGSQTHTYSPSDRPYRHDGVFHNMSGIRATNDPDVLSYSKADSAMICAMQCVENNKCNGFTINKGTYECNLLSQINTTTQNESWNTFILCSK